MDLDQILAGATGALMPRFTHTLCGTACCVDQIVTMRRADLATAAKAAQDALAKGARIRVRKDRVAVTDPDARGQGGWGVHAPVAVFLLPR